MKNTYYLASFSKNTLVSSSVSGRIFCVCVECKNVCVYLDVDVLKLKLN